VAALPNWAVPAAAKTKPEKSNTSLVPSGSFWYCSFSSISALVARPSSLVSASKE